MASRPTAEARPTAMAAALMHPDLVLPAETGAGVSSEIVAERGPEGFLSAAILLGIGLGGFFDGIVLHQILQWHHMVSTPTPPDTLANLQLNTVGDGLFHALTWLVTLMGILLLARSNGERTPPDALRCFSGGLLIGWGLFNVVEGVIDHHLLNLHHVRPGPDELVYDLGFLAWGASMLIVGVLLARRRTNRTVDRTS
jgi:uncharacterized membrane protein